jgi:hypothetical protein
MMHSLNGRAGMMLMSIVVLVGAGSTGVAQVSARDSAFIAAAKRGAAKYRMQAAAIADGFRPVGVEFPAMGEHWVSLQRVMTNTIDPVFPSVLIYVTVNGRPTLGGVGYTDLLRPGEPLPQTPASGFWHEHNGSIAEESFPLRHQMGQESHPIGDDAPRLAILHLWTEIPNDAGAFATDNWSLPFRRLGIDAHLGKDAMRALALAQDETSYYALMLRDALHPSDGEDIIIDHVVADARATAIKRVAAFRAATMDRRASAAPQEASLAAAWSGMWRALDDKLPSRRTQLRALRSQLTSESLTF